VTAPLASAVPEVAPRKFSTGYTFDPVASSSSVAVAVPTLKYKNFVDLLRWYQIPRNLLVF